MTAIPSRGLAGGTFQEAGGSTGATLWEGQPTQRCEDPGAGDRAVA
jgi:hypothetical protein